MNKRNILIGLGIIFILIQFIQTDKTNPETRPGQDLIEVTNPPAEVVRIMKTACYDCHSHETKYPWYSYITPVNFWLKGHIEEGRENLNFSTWNSQTPDKAKHKLEESAEETRQKHMPLTPYWMMHWEAKLSPEERETLASWFDDIKKAYK